MSDQALVDAVLSGKELLALELAADQSLRNARTSDRSSCLQLAVRNGMYELADRLVREGVDLDAQNEYGMTAVHTLIATLGANSTATERAKLLSLLKTILDLGADLSLERTQDGCTPLMLAAAFALDAAVTALLDCGADINASSVGGSALSRAAFEGHTTTVRLLIDRGAFVNDRDRSDQTPLLHAAVNGHVKIVRALIDAGADPNIQTKSGFTGLMHACYKGHGDVVRVLIERGADLQLRDNDGNGPVEYARGGRAIHVMEILRATGDGRRR